MPISAFTYETDAPWRTREFRAHRVLNDGIVDDDTSQGFRRLARRYRARTCLTQQDLDMTAHELRLPLSEIKGFVSSLRRTDVTWDEETRSEFLAEIEIETDRLTQLIDSLLTARARCGKVDCFPELALTNPACVIQGALHRIRGLLKSRKRPLRLDVPPSLPSVWMDASGMERVLANLIQNAIKYSPPHTPIGVSARITYESELELSVDDHGAGIAVGDRERVFEPFFRSETTDRSTADGHGLGLAICQAIVRAHGGRIQLFDRIGGGTRFSVVLPAQVRAGQFESKHQAKDHGNDPAKHSRGGRRGANAQAPGYQSQSQRLRRAVGRRRLGGLAVARGVPLRPTAA
jgi:two-component system sensor histidine kinase KdpD